MIGLAAIVFGFGMMLVIASLSWLMEDHEPQPLPTVHLGEKPRPMSESEIEALRQQMNAQLNAFDYSRTLQYGAGIAPLSQPDLDRIRAQQNVYGGR